jgi:hypothetical protein
MNSRKLSIIYALLCIVGVMLLGLPTVGFAAALFSFSFIGGLVLWMATTYRTPIDPSKIIVPYLLTVIFFIVEVYEEYLTNIASIMTQMSGFQVLERDFLTVTAFLAPIVWITGALALLKRWHFGYFLASAFLFDMMFANVSHFAFPFLMDGTFHYVSGMYTAILPTVAAWYTFYILLREIRSTRISSEPKPQDSLRNNRGAS